MHSLFEMAAQMALNSVATAQGNSGVAMYVNLLQTRKPACRLSSSVFSKSLTEGLCRASFSVSGLFPRSGEFLGGGHRREERVRVSDTRTRAYREEDWAKLFKPEAVNKEELKEYLNDDPIWLWVFKSWRRFVESSPSVHVWGQYILPK